MENTKQLRERCYGFIAISILVFSTILGFIPVLLLGILKLFPSRHLKIFCTEIVDIVASCWSAINNAYIDRTQKIAWDIQGIENLSQKNWYLVIANHQSWLDIVVLQRIFNRKIPVLKFFIKDQLKWIPFFGFAWWAMGCPFMKRYSKEYLAKKPHKRGQDLLATQKAIELFKQTPAAIMNFVEGTRFTPHKNKHQQSPYEFLLKPKAGGIGFVISTMGQKFTSLLDVTIIYSSAKPSLWDFLCRRVHAIKVHINQLSIPKQFLSGLDKTEVQIAFREWLNHNWYEKDKLIRKLKSQL